MQASLFDNLRIISVYKIYYVIWRELFAIDNRKNVNLQFDNAVFIGSVYLAVKYEIQASSRVKRWI